MESNTYEALVAQAIGREVLRYLRQEEPLKRIAEESESKAVQVLREIQAVLDDDTPEDPECFQRIDAIVDLYNDHHMYTPRHDF